MTFGTFRRQGRMCHSGLQARRATVLYSAGTAGEQKIEGVKSFCRLERFRNYQEGHMASAGDAIVAEDLRKYYGKTRAVDGISVRVSVGEIFGMLGPNGAGKSTT